MIPPGTKFASSRPPKTEVHGTRLGGKNIHALDRSKQGHDAKAPTVESLLAQIKSAARSKSLKVSSDDNVMDSGETSGSLPVPSFTSLFQGLENKLRESPLESCETETASTLTPTVVRAKNLDGIGARKEDPPISTKDAPPSFDFSSHLHAVLKLPDLVSPASPVDSFNSDIPPDRLRLDAATATPMIVKEQVRSEKVVDLALEVGANDNESWNTKFRGNLSSMHDDIENPQGASGHPHAKDAGRALNPISASLEKITTIAIETPPRMSATAQIVENILAAKIEPSRMIETIDQNMKVLKIIEVKLQPEELGRVTVTLKTMRGLLKVEVAAEKQSTQEDLEQNVQQLAVGLGGIQAAEITFAKASSPMDSAASIFQSLSSSGIQASLQNAADDGSHRGQAGQRNNEGDVSSHLVVPAEHSEAIANPALRHNRADGIYL